MIVFGIIVIILPFLLDMLRYASGDFYFWLIHLPEPFASMGSGPFQLWLHVGFVGLGIVAILIGRMERDA